MSEIISVAVGVALSGILQFGILQWQHRQKINSIKAGFAAEIKNILNGVNFWKLDKLIQTYVNCLSNNQPIPQERPKVFNQDITFKFYNNLSADIGYLPQNIVQDIVLFYGNASAVLEDIENLHSTKAMNIPAYDIIKKDQGLFNQAITTGEKLLKELEIKGNTQKNKTGRYIPFGENHLALLDTETGAVYIPANDRWELNIKPIK